ncbi:MULTISPECIES: tetratricopeptide repeat protein [unclassified Leptolyngbya]|uniref:tetratricopeptide repeat protein n=1 Tax=unclassified Leptolyngbya TaxID=2650499 RepID=UPI00168A29E6|nr:MULTISPECIES: tetratricopeptide repeat protein [unclassified Leptolyngbya]MBD1909881.1 tetratricopeptide repeat protein [Leptolyngbya sp. FACHB-8]MBD2156977.1 tetratricopeptide repeat protein [Leptolyngbya sp. FACHB-16]
MLNDIQGLPVSTDSPEAIAAVNAYIEQSLQYGRDAETVILKGIEADPQCAIAHAYAAAYYLSQENHLDRVQAILHIRQAQRHLHKLSRREQLFIGAITAWSNGNIEQAIAYHEALAQAFPQDLLSVQQGQYHYFYQGDSDRLLRIAEAALPFYETQPLLPYLYGMIAFGLEQCHQMEQAEAMGRFATQLHAQNPWAHHAVAHVLEAQGRHSEGAAWMESVAESWKHCNSMLYTHNWWHVALFYLAQGDAQTVLKLYDQHVWGGARQHSPKDQVGAVSLLLRLELLGADVGDRWDALAQHLRARVSEHALPFQDLHYVYGLARGNELALAETMVQDMARYAQTLNPAHKHLWLTLALPAAQGILFYAKRNWGRAIAYLQPVLPHLYQLGGSHTQRLLFQQLYQHALMQQNSGNPRIQVSNHLIAAKR